MSLSRASDPYFICSSSNVLQTAVKEWRTVCTGLPQGVILHKCVNMKQAGTRIRLAHSVTFVWIDIVLKKQHKIRDLWGFIIIPKGAC